MVDVDTGPSGVKYEGMDDARHYVERVLGEPAVVCQTANRGWHLYYIVGEAMEWTRHPWIQEGNGGGDIIYDRQQAVLYEPSVVFAAAVKPTGSRVTRMELDLLRGVEEIKAPAPKPIETSTDKDRQAATASLAWIPPDVGISTLIWIARDNGAPRR